MFNKKRNKVIKITPTQFGWGYGYGFFSNYRVCLQQLITNHYNKNKYIPYIDWRNTTWVEGFDPAISKAPPKVQKNPFDYWFEQYVPSKNDKIYISNGKLNFNIIDHALDYFNSDSLMIQKEVDQMYIKPKKVITDRVEELYEKEFKNNVILGVMARGSEYNYHHPFYGVFGIEQYIEEIYKILDKHPDINKIFAVSEDLNYIKRIADEFKNVYFVPNVFRRTDETDEYINRVHYWCNVSNKRENHTRRLGEEVILQTKLLGKSDYLLGRHSGILCGAVLWNENIRMLYKIDKNATNTDIIK